jgi:hypothetical protein
MRSPSSTPPPCLTNPLSVVGLRRLQREHPEQKHQSQTGYGPGMGCIQEALRRVGLPCSVTVGSRRRWGATPVLRAAKEILQ